MAAPSGGAGDHRPYKASEHTPDEQTKVDSVCSFTGAVKAAARDYLQAAGWSVEVAADQYFSDPPPPGAYPPDSDEDGGGGGGGGGGGAGASGGGDVGALGTLFERFRQMDEDAEPDTMGPGGFEGLLTELGVDANDAVVMVLLWRLQAKTLGELTREEFVGGLSALGVDGLAALRDRLPSLRSEVSDSADLFADFYGFVFAFLLSPEQHTLDAETAIEMWRCVFTLREFPLLDPWLAFLADTKVRGVNKDTWALLLKFSTEVRPDLSNFDADDAWPVAIDDFVEWYQSREQASGRATKPARVGAGAGDDSDSDSSSSSSSDTD